MKHEPIIYCNYCHTEMSMEGNCTDKECPIHHLQVVLDLLSQPQNKVTDIPTGVGCTQRSVKAGELSRHVQQDRSTVKHTLRKKYCDDCEEANHYTTCKEHGCRCECHEWNNQTGGCMADYDSVHIDSPDCTCFACCHNYTECKDEY